MLIFVPEKINISDKMSEEFRQYSLRNTFCKLHHEQE